MARSWRLPPASFYQKSGQRARALGAAGSFADVRSNMWQLRDQVLRVLLGRDRAEELRVRRPEGLATALSAGVLTR